MLFLHKETTPSHALTRELRNPFVFKALIKHVNEKVTLKLGKHLPGFGGKEEHQASHILIMYI